eukprot:3019806-Rhodomonas_salina.4
MLQCKGLIGHRTWSSWALASISDLHSRSFSSISPVLRICHRHRTQSTKTRSGYNMDHPEATSRARRDH